MSYQLEVLEVGDVTAKLRPRTLLTDEIQRSLRMNCLTAIAELDSDDNLLVQNLLDEFGIEEEDLIYMAAYLWILSSRVAYLVGADFDFVKRSDNAAAIRAKLTKFMASSQSGLVKAIDDALATLDKPYDDDLAPNVDTENLPAEQKKSGPKSKKASTSG